MIIKIIIFTEGAIMNLSKRLMPEYIRLSSWLMILMFFLFPLKNILSQDKVYNAPDVSIFSEPEKVFELPGAGDYIGPERLKKYNFSNINDILRETPGVYSREETGVGLIHNISIRGTATLRSTQINMLEDGINIAPAPYSAPDSYYSPITRKMNAIEILKGSSQYRFGPHSTGGSINYLTTPVDLGTRYFGSVSYASGNDVITHDYANYGVSGQYGAFAILGEVYYRNGGGRRDFNIEPPNSSVHRKNYGSDDLGDMNHIAPMVKMLWQLPTSRNMVFEVKYAYEDNNYNNSYAGQTTADFNANPHQQYVGYQLGEYNTEHHTSYVKFRADLSSNIKNVTTGYFNYFTRDWFKLDKVVSNGSSCNLETVVSKAATGNCGTAALNILKGSTTGQLRYKNNDRQYGAYGIMNETDFSFNTNIFGKNIGHELKVGYKYHYDYHHRDQQNHNFQQAAGGLITAHPTATNLTAAEDRKETSRGHVAYFEESATINNFVASFGARFEYVDMHYRNGAGDDDDNIKEETFMFAPGGGLVYNHDDNWQWFGGAYKGFNIASPGTVRDDGTPVEKETSVATEIGVRYTDENLLLTMTGFRTTFKDLIVINNSNSDSTPDNAGNVITKGIELASRYQPQGWVPTGDLSLFAAYTFTNANLDGAASATDSKASLFAGGLDGSNVPYVPDHRLSIGFDYDYSKFSFGMNMTYQSESYGTAAETETEVHNGTANARAGRIDSYALANFYAGYEVTDNARIKVGVNNFTDLEYIATRHPQGARAGAPLTAYVNASISY